MSIHEFDTFYTGKIDCKLGIRKVVSDNNAQIANIYLPAQCALSKGEITFVCDAALSIIEVSHGKVS